MHARHALGKPWLATRVPLLPFDSVGARPGAGERAGGVDGTGVGPAVRATLARWLLHKRRAADSRRPQAHDEATHAWDGRRRFAEEYSFAAVQPGLALLVRLEWLPGRAAHRTWVMILHGEDCWWIPPDETIVGESIADRWRAGGIVLECDQPLARWTVTHRGALAHATSRKRARSEIGLEFERIADPFVPGTDDDPDLVARRLAQTPWDRALLRAVRRERQQGYVQPCRVRGTIALGDALIGVDAQGVRQHHWGVRDWGAPERAWQVLWRDDARDKLAWAQHADFPSLTLEGGFVCERGRTIAVRSLDERAEPGRCFVGLVSPTESLTASGIVGASAAMRVDGRGELELGRIDGDDGAVGLWCTLRRALPRALVPR